MAYIHLLGPLQGLCFAILLAFLSLLLILFLNSSQAFDMLEMLKKEEEMLSAINEKKLQVLN